MSRSREAMIFISYQRANKVIAKQIRKQIGDAKLLTWMDEDIQPGQEWKAEIDTALDACTAVIVLVTFASLTSPFVTYEWSYALGKGKVVVPVILEMPDPKNEKHPPMHPKLQDRQYQFTVESDHEEWQVLIQTLRGLENALEIPADIQLAVLALRNPDIAIRKQAIDALGTFEHQAATNALANAIQSGYPDVAQNAGIGLAIKTNYQDSSALPGLLKALRAENMSIVQMAIRCLVRYRTDEAVAGTVVAFQATDVNNGVARNILVTEGLCKMRHPLATKELIKLLETNAFDSEPVINALGESRSNEVLPVLKAHSEYLAVHLPRHKTRMNVLDAIAKIDDPSTPFILADIMKMTATDDALASALFDKALAYLTAIGGEVVIGIFSDPFVGLLPYSQRNNVNSRRMELQNRLNNQHK
jgi:HEAT repeat protein